jgi:hypothetical protein
MQDVSRPHIVERLPRIRSRSSSGKGAVMITRTGMYRVKVSAKDNPTHLHDGIYQVTVQKPKNLQSGSYLTTVYKPLDRKDETLNEAMVKFKGAAGTNAPSGNGSWFYQPGAYETLARMDILEEEGRVVCSLIEQPVLDAIANRLHGKKWLELLEKEQIAACKMMESESGLGGEGRGSWTVMRF